MNNRDSQLPELLAEATSAYNNITTTWSPQTSFPDMILNILVKVRVVVRKLQIGHDGIERMCYRRNYR